MSFGKRVTFAKHVTVHEIPDEDRRPDFSHVERERFRRRIKNLELLLEPIFSRKMKIVIDMQGFVVLRRICAKGNGNWHWY